jgi:hypothetical protein
MKSERKVSNPMSRQRKRKTRFSVVVGNVGKVYEGSCPELASLIFNNYIEMSKAPFGTASGQDVTMLDGQDVVKEYLAPVAKFARAIGLKMAHIIR